MGDIRPVAIVAISPDVIAIHPSNPAKDLKEFIANAKTKSFTYGSAGAGTGPQIGAEYFFKEVAKVHYVHVPFQGGAPAITATLGNHVDSLVLTFPTVTPQMWSGACAASASPATSAIRRSRTCRPTARWASERLFAVLGRFLRAGQDARCRRAKAQHRNQRADEGAGSLEKFAKAGSTRWLKTSPKRTTTSRAK